MTPRFRIKYHSEIQKQAFSERKNLFSEKNQIEMIVYNEMIIVSDRLISIFQIFQEALRSFSVPLPEDWRQKIVRCEHGVLEPLHSAFID